MNQDFEIDAVGVRSCAAGLAETGVQVVGDGGRAPVPVAGPRWACGDATTRAADVGRRRLRTVGDEIAEAARQIVAAVLDYEDADDRAATRLRSTR